MMYCTHVQPCDSQSPLQHAEEGEQKQVSAAHSFYQLTGASFHTSSIEMSVARGTQSVGMQNMLH